MILPWVMFQTCSRQFVAPCLCKDSTAPSDTTAAWPCPASSGTDRRASSKPGGGKLGQCWNKNVILNCNMCQELEYWKFNADDNSNRFWSDMFGWEISMICGWETKISRDIWLGNQNMTYGWETKISHDIWLGNSWGNNIQSHMT